MKFKTKLVRRTSRYAYSWPWGLTIPSIYIGDFEQIVRWKMLRAVLDSPMTLEEIAQKCGRTVRGFFKTITNMNANIRTIASVFYVLGMDVRFNTRPLDDWSARERPF